MDTSTVLSVTGNFLKFVGEVVADLKRQEAAKVDAELLKLKRQVLTEQLEEFKSKLAAAVSTEKGRSDQDLISRGLGNTTIRESNLLAIEKNAADEAEKAHREYNRAIEEIALMERKVQEQAVPSWKKLLRWLGRMDRRWIRLATEGTEYRKGAMPTALRGHVFRHPLPQTCPRKAVGMAHK